MNDHDLPEWDDIDHDAAAEAWALGKTEETSRSSRPEPQPQPPELPDAARYGLAGEVLNIAEPITEADPAAVLVSFLAAAGNLIGPSPFTVGGNTRHPARISPLIVGDSAKARKGTSWSVLRPILDATDSGWLSGRVQSGFGSGETIVDSVADPDPDDEGENAPQDRRLFVYAPEFASVLKVANRDGSTLSGVLREAWDSGRLETRSRGHGRKIATGAHVSVLGHITADELRRYLTATESANGFANRFLFIYARRSKVLPFGGELEDTTVDDIACRLWTIRDVAIKRGRTTWAGQDARDLWAKIYTRLGDDDPGGLLGAVTARAEAQTLRLALLYALLDGATGIGPEHLTAARALWQYARDSAAYIFGDRLGDELADKFLRAIRQRPDGMTSTELAKLEGNRNAGRRSHALDTLATAGFIVAETVATDGRPATIYRPCTAQEAQQAQEVPR